MAGYFSYFGVKDYTLTDDVQKKVVDLSQYSTIFSKIADNVLFYSYYTMQDGERLDTISQKLYGTPEYYWVIPLVNTAITNVFRDMPKDYPTFVEYLKKKYPGSAFKLAAGQTIAGKFNIGEIVSFNTTNKAKIIGKYPTNGYLHVEVIAGTFPLSSNFTITGASTSHTVTVASVIPAYDAPSYYVNTSGNNTRWNAAGTITPVLIREIELDKNTSLSQIRVIRPKYIYEIAKQFEAEMKRATL